MGVSVGVAVSVGGNGVKVGLGVRVAGRETAVLPIVNNKTPNLLKTK
jgi:hypothetical protein